MKKTYSGKAIIRAGETLIDSNISINSSEFESAMDVLSYWRLIHETPLSNAQKIVESEALKIDKSAFTAKRLKRYVSIVNKLKRFNDMKLKNMQDIGGCRVVVSNTKKLTQLIRSLRRRPEFKSSAGFVRHKDYISNPKEDGYRSYHLIGRFRDIQNAEKNIEVQLRTRLQHDWATALEIVDIFTKQKLKSNQGDKKWSSFFKYVSEQFSIMESIHLLSIDNPKTWNAYLEKVLSRPESYESCIAAQKLIKELSVVKKFEAFTHSLNFVDGQLEKIPKEKYGFVLINVDLSKSQIQLEFFEEKNVENAERSYIECEKRIAGRNDYVAALVSTTAVDGIKEAYPNYFADSSEFLRHLILISAAPIQNERANLIDKITDPIIKFVLNLVNRLTKTF
ncbi:MAG: RelA/SpoT domain-containing protein [Betaproteobacteria bacterium]